jgi:predicted Zn-dependent protease
MVRLAGLLAIMGVLGFFAWETWKPMPKPPEVNLEGADKSVVQAVEHAREKVLKDPRSADSWSLMGKVLMANGFEKDGLQCLAQAEKLDPKEARWPYLQGMYMLRGQTSGDPEVALRYFRRAVAVSEKYGQNQIPYRLTLAELLERNQQTEEAAVHYQWVQQNDPKNLRLSFFLGRQAFANNELDKAIKYLTPVTKDSSARQKAMSLLAQIYHRKGNAAKANELTKKAALLPEDEGWSDDIVEEVIILNVGRQGKTQKIRYLEQSGRMAEAEEIRREMEAEDKNNSEMAQINRAGTMLQARKPMEAEQILRPLLQGKSNAKLRIRQMLAHALFIQGDVWLREAPDKRELALRKLRECVKYCREVILIEPLSPTAHLYLGRCLVHLGERKEGIEALRFHLNTRSEQAQSHLYLGLALAEDGQDEEALKRLEEAARIAPQETKVLDLIKKQKEKMAQKKKPG